MRILLTGGFGTVGISILDLFIEKGHEVTVFEVKNKKNIRRARRYSSGPLRIFWGDIRKISDLERAAAGQDAIVHCAAIVPPFSDENEKLCFDINVGGTQNVIDAIKKVDDSVPLVFISSASVMGPTQDREPFLSVSDPVNPVDSYARSKVEAENLLKNSGLRYCVLRLGAVMPGNLFNAFKQFKIAFEIPLRARCEVVLDSDVATACVHASEIMARGGLVDGVNGVDGSIFFIGGGRKNGCQVTALQMYEGIFTPLGIKLPQATMFTEDLNNYYIDWYDTDSSQRILDFQNHTFDDFRATLRKKYRFLLPLIKIFNPLIELYIDSKSPYGKLRKEAANG